MLRQKFITLRIFVEENKKKKILNENNNCKLNINHRKLDLNYFLIVVLVDVRHEIIKKRIIFTKFHQKKDLPFVSDQSICDSTQKFKAKITTNLKLSRIFYNLCICVCVMLCKLPQ